MCEVKVIKAIRFLMVFMSGFVSCLMLIFAFIGDSTYTFISSIVIVAIITSCKMMIKALGGE